MKFGNGASRSLKRVKIEYTRIPVIRTCVKYGLSYFVSCRWQVDTVEVWGSSPHEPTI
jgi:hypothetical protein